MMSLLRKPVGTWYGTARERDLARNGNKGNREGKVNLNTFQRTAETWRQAGIQWKAQRSEGVSHSCHRLDFLGGPEQ